MRRYNGCELESPLYRQVAAEMAAERAKRGLHSTISMPINEYKPIHYHFLSVNELKYL
jgi:hypothetical protein